LPGIAPIEPDANFVLYKLVGASVTGQQIAGRMYVEHSILVKDCAGKRMPDADRFLRLAWRTPDENRGLVKALAALP
jgi:histidinol-phosphate/aromatic aminotransferase/cobyric acid decarboxylase-like protein